MTTRAALLLAIALAACSSDDPAADTASPAGAGGTTGAQGGAAGSAAGAGGTGAASGSPAGQGGATAGAGGVAAGAGGQLAAGSGGAGGPAGAAGAGGAAVCTPGTTQECVGPGACKGGQACKDDGTGYGACDCGTGGAAGAGGAEGGAAGVAQGGAGVGGAGASGSGGEGGAAGAAGACTCTGEVTAAMWPPNAKEGLGADDVKYCTPEVVGDSLCDLTANLHDATWSAEVAGGAVTFSGVVPVWLPVMYGYATVYSATPAGKSEAHFSVAFGEQVGGEIDVCKAGAWAPVQVTWTGPINAPDAAPGFGCSDLGASTAFSATFPGDAWHTCDSCLKPEFCGGWDASKALAFQRVRDKAAEVLRAALDKAATGKACK